MNPRPQRPERCALTKLRYSPVGISLPGLLCGDRGWAVGVVLESTAAEDGVDGAGEAHGIERLHQPAVGVGVAGKEDVSTAVEEHEHGNVGKPSRTLLQAEVEAGGHPAHLADLQVQDGEIGRPLGDRGAYLKAAGHLTDSGVGVGQHRLDVLPDPRRVAGDEDVRHPPRVARGRDG